MDDSGYSNYNGLQVEFRQRQWHGMTLNANYTLSKTFGVAVATDFAAGYNAVHVARPPIQRGAASQPTGGMSPT